MHAIRSAAAWPCSQPRRGRPERTGGEQATSVAIGFRCAQIVLLEPEGARLAGRGVTLALLVAHHRPSLTLGAGSKPGPSSRGSRRRRTAPNAEPTPGATAVRATPPASANPECPRSENHPPSDACAAENPSRHHRPSGQGRHSAGVGSGCASSALTARTKAPSPRTAEKKVGTLRSRTPCSAQSAA